MPLKRENVAKTYRARTSGCRHGRRQLEIRAPFRHDQLCDVPHIHPARTALMERRASQKNNFKDLGSRHVTYQKRSVGKISSCCHHGNDCADRHDRLCGYGFCERAGNAFTRYHNNASCLESRRDDHSIGASIAAGLAIARYACSPMQRHGQLSFPHAAVCPIGVRYGASPRIATRPSSTSVAK